MKWIGPANVVSAFSVPVTFSAVSLFSLNIAQAQMPGTSCPDQIVPLTISVGDRIPLPKSFSNPTGRRVEFTVTMLANPIFGPSRVVQTVTLDAGTGRTASEPPIYPTTINTPTRTALIEFEVTTNRNDHGVVGNCRYQVTIDPPPPTITRHPIFNVPVERGLVQIPVRICVIKGSILASGADAGETIEGGEIYDLLLSANEDIWYRQAGIAFSTSLDEGFPVVADPTESSQCSIPGDVMESGFGGGGEDEQVAAQCAAAWDSLYPGRLGLPVVFVRNICSAAKGVSSSAPAIFRIGFSRNSDLCNSPRNIEKADLTDESHPDFMVLEEPGPQGGTKDSVTRTLAHELGHNLFLGHGNGLDDDENGAPVGMPGPRLYDAFCDSAEDVSPEGDCGAGGWSLMSAEESTCNTMLPHQIETARDIGTLMPGARVFDPEIPNAPDDPRRREPNPPVLDSQ